MSGINRFLGEFGLFLPLYGENLRNKHLPKELREVDKVMYNQYAGSSTGYESIGEIQENASNVLVGKTLEDMPILVLSSDSGKAWQKTQEQLAKWSSNSKQVTIPDSSHYLYWSHYDKVIEEIETFIGTYMME